MMAHIFLNTSLVFVPRVLTPAFRSRSRPRALFASGLAVLALTVLVLPIDVPDRVEVPGRVMPAQAWVVAQNANGAVTATLRDYRSGSIEATFAAEPERGDAVRFHLGPGADREVAAGDTIGHFASGEAALRLVSLHGDLDAARAEVRLRSAAEKEAVVEAARHEVRRAEAALNYAERLTTRQRELLDRGVVAEDEFDDAESRWRLAEAEAAAAHARLDAVQTGARTAEIDWAQARVTALEREAASLAERLDSGTLVAPIGGIAYRMFSSDTLLMVADTSALFVMLPVRWSDRQRIVPGQEVTLRTTEWGEQPRARVLDVRDAATPFAGQPYLVATAEVVAGGEALTPGLLVSCLAETGSQTPLEYAGDVVSSLFRW